MSSFASGEASLDVVKAAISQLGVNREADSWLSEFESKAQAWTIASVLLVEPPTSVFRFWGAKILYRKIRYDITQLDANSVQQLKLHLVSQVISLSAEPNLNFPVIRYVCLALSALCVETAEDGVISQILLWLNDVVVNKPLVILELLILLAEEVSDSRSRGKAENLARQLSASAGQVFDFLDSVSASSPANVRNKVLKCFQVWIDTTTGIPAEFALSKPLYLSALGGLQTVEMLESSCEVITTTIRRYCYGNRDHNHDNDSSESKSAGGETVANAVLNALSPHVLALRGVWAGVKVDPDDEENICLFRAMARLFTEFCDASIELQIRGAMVGEADMMAQLLQCVAFEHDMNVASTPLAYFYRLYDRIENDQLEHRDSLREKYKPCFSALLDQIHGKLLQIEIDDSVDDKPEARRDWQDSTVDCCGLLGADECLRKICTWLQRDASESNVPAISASLICLRSLGKYIPPSEKVCISWVVGVLPELWKVPDLKDEIVRVVGVLSPWIALNTACVPPLIGMLREALNTEMLAVQASKSILDMCKYAADFVPVADLHAQVVAMRPFLLTPSLFEVDSNILEACCVGISKLSSVDAGAALQIVLSPVATSLMEKVSAIAASGSPPKPIVEEILRDLSRLTSVYRYTCIDMTSAAPGSQNPLFGIFVQLFPVIQQLIGTVPTFRVHEKVCRFYKYMIRSLKDSFVGNLGAMCNHLADCFSRYGTSPFVYACSIW
jgi:hypothetical protein